MQNNQSDHDLLIKLQVQLEELRNFMKESLKNLEEKIEDRQKHAVPIQEFIRMKTQVNENTSMRKFIYGASGTAVVALIGAIIAIIAWTQTL